jgi:hypothetical protein
MKRYSFAMTRRSRLRIGSSLAAHFRQSTMSRISMESSPARSRCGVHLGANCDRSRGSITLSKRMIGIFRNRVQSTLDNFIGRCELMWNCSGVKRITGTFFWHGVEHSVWPGTNQNWTFWQTIQLQSSFTRL